MNKIKAILIEDEPLARENCEKMVKKIGIIELAAVFENPIEAMEMVKSGQVELILSDIQMPEMDGISFLRSLQNPPFVIFITGHPDFALDGFELDVLDYIIKPLTEQRLRKALDKARKAIDYNKSSDQQEYIRIKDRNRTAFLKREEIFYVRGWGDYVKIITTGGLITPSCSLKEMEKILPGKHFFRIQRSYIVNVEYIGSVDATKVVLKNKEELPIGLQYRRDFYDRMGIKE